ncbi:TonB-dependent receptor [Balneolales bacterium ANBcel1]|nr:TonB-dependent receptor [Balneolales bacterium ANBcel1]
MALKDGITRKGSHALLLKRLGRVTVGIGVLLLAGLAGPWLPAAMAQETGTVSGEIRDADTGETLIGANILIQGMNIGAASDVDGRYVLRRVPEGEQILEFRYIGFRSKEVPVTVVPGERVRVNVRMEPEHFLGEEVQIVARQRGQSRALTRQRQSTNIRSVISDEQIEAFGDNTVAGALSRVAGMGHGGANIRGVGAGASNITMDGQRMGSTGGDRSVDLSTISADMVQELDVVKVITPDMDADALSGVIEISTRRPVGGEREINIRAGGGFQDRYLPYAGSEYRGSFSYVDSPNDQFSFGFNMSYQRDPQSTESFSVNWAPPRSFQTVNRDNYSEEYQALLPAYIFDEDFDDSIIRDRISSLNNQVDFNIRDRYGAGLQMTFQPTDMTTFHVQGMFNYQDQQRTRHGMNYLPRVANYQSPYHTGDPSWTGPDAENQGTIRYNARLDEADIHQYTVQAGARHRFDSFDLEYSLGWGHGRFTDDQYRFGFHTHSRHEFIFDLEDRWEPKVDIAPWSENRTVSPSALRHADDGGSLDHHKNKVIDNDFKVSLDVEVPYVMGTMKFGSSSSMRFMRGSGEILASNYRSNLTIQDFRLMENASWNIFDRDHTTYMIPWMIDLPAARDFYIHQAPSFRADMETWALSTETSEYDAQEHTFAAYGMADVKFNWITILGGVRVEHTYTHYEGREGTIDANGNFRGATDISSTNRYTNLFPNLQTVFGLGRMTNIRLAYSRSIGRPNFDQLSPYIMRDYSSRRIEQGNPNLKPMLSNNYDFMFEHYFMNVGQITFGLFYKQLSDFVYSFTERIGDDEDDDFDEAEFAGWQRVGFRNGEEATVYGVEIAWQQRLDFLPGVMRNLGLYANYSYTQSIADVDRDAEGDVRQNHTHGLADLLSFFGRSVDPDYKEITPLTNQRPHVVNLGLDFSYNDFFTQISYQWAAPSISSYGDGRFVPEIRRDYRVYFDQYNDAANDLSVTMRYWVTGNFQIWADASNILNNRSINYYYDRDYYPSTSSLRGRRITAGLRYRL